MKKNQITYKDYIDAKNLLETIENAKEIVESFDKHKLRLWKLRKERKIDDLVLYDPYMQDLVYFEKAIKINRLILNNLEYKFRDEPKASLEIMINHIKNQLLQQRKDWLRLKKMS